MSPANFNLLQDALRRAGTDTDAAECHGTVCGIVCAAGDGWLENVLDASAAGDAPAAECRELLLGLSEEARGLLRAPDMGFYPLLPADDTSLPQRATALGEWCRGFLYGLSLGCTPGVLENLAGDAGEILRDMTEIARAGIEAQDSDEQDENAYTEIVEYVRVSVQLLFEELNPPQPGAHRAAPGLH